MRCSKRGKQVGTKRQNGENKRGKTTKCWLAISSEKITWSRPRTGRGTEFWPQMSEMSLASFYFTLVFFHSEDLLLFRYTSTLYHPLIYAATWTGKNVVLLIFSFVFILDEMNFVVVVIAPCQKSWFDCVYNGFCLLNSLMFWLFGLALCNLVML